MHTSYDKKNTTTTHVVINVQPFYVLMYTRYTEKYRITKLIWIKKNRQGWFYPTHLRTKHKENTIKHVLLICKENTSFNNL